MCDCDNDKRGERQKSRALSDISCEWSLGELVLVEDAEDIAEAAEAAEVFLESPPPPLRRLRLWLLRTEFDLERISSPRSNMADSERPKGDFSFSVVSASIFSVFVTYGNPEDPFWPFSELFSAKSYFK